METLLIGRPHWFQSILSFEKLIPDEKERLTWIYCYTKVPFPGSDSPKITLSVKSLDRKDHMIGRSDIVMVQHQNGMDVTVPVFLEVPSPSSSHAAQVTIGEATG